MPYIHDMTPDAIRHEFVTDMVAGFETRLSRYVDGVQAIATAEKKSVEDIHVEVVEEFRKLGGTELPGT